MNYNIRAFVPFALLILAGYAFAQPAEKKFIPAPTVATFALSPDGATLALAEQPMNIRLWNVATGKDVRKFPIGGTRESFITSLAFAPDGRTLAVAGSGRLQTWDLETGKLRATFNNEVDFTFNKLVRGDDGAFRQVKEIIKKPDNVMAARFSSDGKTLYSSGKEDAIKVWDAATGKEKAKLVGHVTAPTHLAMAQNGKILASGTFEGAIIIWNLETHKAIESFTNERRSIYGLALSADGKKLLSSCGTEFIMWDTAKGMPLGRFTGGKGAANRVAFSPDEKLVVGQALQFMVWDAKTFEVMAAIDPSPVFGIAVTPDSKHLLTCDAKGNVKTHELPKR